MSEVLLRYRGRAMGPAQVQFLRELIAQHPGLSRRRLSLLVCQAWGWVQPNGQPQDMICRGLMLALHRAGHIALPAPRPRVVNNVIAHRRVAAVPELDTRPLQSRLAALVPLELRQVRRTAQEPLFNSLLSRYHYLSYSRPVGEHLKYLVWAAGRPIACLSWSSATRQLDLRDQWVGAPKAAYQHHLHLIAYNHRFLILPWVEVPHLASHLLGRIRRRISADWQNLYHHPVCLLESFVDTERFAGHCYRAANWICVGCSTGRGTRSKTHRQATSRKQLWVYPLGRDARRQLLRPP